MDNNQSQTEPKFQCLYKKSGDNIVKAVFYAIVVSVLASSCCGKNDISMSVALSYFLFFTGYFYDEWRTAYRQIPNRCEVLDVLGWCCFVIQVVTLKTVIISFFAGVLGCFLVSVSLACAEGIPMTWSKRKGWIAQNISWALCLLGLCFVASVREWLIVTVALGIFIMKIVIWFRYQDASSDFPTEEREAQGKNICLNEIILLNRMFCEYKAMPKFPHTNSLPSAVEVASRRLKIEPSRRDELWEYCLVLMEDDVVRSK